MRIRLVVGMVLGAVFCGIGGFGVEATAKENGPIRSKKITLPKEEKTQEYFIRNHFGPFFGTLESSTFNRAKIELPRGDTVEIPLFYFGSPPLSHFLHKMGKIPKKVTDHQMEPGRRKLISMDAAKLPLGSLEKWKNTGLLGGAFQSMNMDPKVVDFKGRRGVRFTYDEAKWHDPEYQALASDFTVTDYLGYESPFTFSAWVHFPKTIQEGHNQIFSWGALCGDQQTVLSMGQSDVAGLSVVAGDVAIGGSPEWQHITYSYTGGHDGLLSVYRDGKRVSTHRYDVKAERRPVTDITTTTATLNGEFFYKEGPGSVIAFWGDMDFLQWYQLRHYYWDGGRDLNSIPAGEFRTELTGLKPNTKYYYRYAAQNLPAANWNYPLTPGRRWAYGPGSFVTASEDGTPGRNLPEDSRQHFFIGANRGTRWFMATPGPSLFFIGAISELSLYDYAMDEFEVRQSIGMQGAFEQSPAEAEEVYADTVTLSWKQGRAGVTSYRVWCGADKAAVESGRAKSTATQKTSLEIKEMLRGVKHYWRVAQLDKEGKELDGGNLWSFENTLGKARAPRPMIGETVNPTHILNWDGVLSSLEAQRIYIAESPEALATMKTPVYGKGLVEHHENRPSDVHPDVYPTMDILRPGRTLYWRVDFVHEGGRVVTGPQWHFTVRDYHSPEPDTIWAKPGFDHDDRADTGVKQVDAQSFLSRAAPSAPSKVLRDEEAFGFSRYLYKSKRLRDFLESQPAASNTGYAFDGPRYGNGFVAGAYGDIRGDHGKGERLYGNNMIMHEFGHHLHVALNDSHPEFIVESEDIFDGHKDNNIGLGGYNAANIGENLAITIHLFSFADNRDDMYHTNRRQYNMLRKYLAGDLHIDLNPRKHLRSDAEANLVSWGNDGGLITYNKDLKVLAYVHVPNTQGEFTPVGKTIPVKQIGGVMALEMVGKSALVWSEKTKLGLYGNRDFAVEFWAKKTPGSADNAVITAFSGADGKTIQFTWNDFPGAKEGVWQHLAYVYEGGGGTGKEAGLLRVYINGKEVSATKRKFDLPKNASVSIGGLVSGAVTPTVSRGFIGNLGQVRIYNYDISADQVKEHYDEEAPHYTRVPNAVAGKLYVDLDSLRYTDMPQGRHRPFHPKNLRKPWIRSWANFGTLSGRLHNDVDTFMWDYTGSTPIMRAVHGASVPVFTGKDRMVSGFKPNAEMVASPPGALEMWIKRDVCSHLLTPDTKEVALEWGDYELTDAQLEKIGVKADGAWRHLVIVFPKATHPAPPRFYNWENYQVANRKFFDEKKMDETEKQIREAGKHIQNAQVFVDGKSAGVMPGLLRPLEYDRLHLGGHYDFDFWNWKYYFNGAFASVRVHKGRLTPAQIKANAAKKPLDEPKPGTPVDLIFEVNAASLPDGAFTKLPSTVKGGSAFLTGNRGTARQPVIKEHNGESALELGPRTPLQSSFKIPAAMRKGSFTIIARAARASSKQSTRLLSWNESTFRVGPEPEQELFSWMEKRDDGGSTHRIRKGVPEDAPRLRDYFAKPTAYNPNAYMGYVWKTVCLSYDGKTLRYFVDGDLQWAEATTFSVRPEGAKDHLFLGETDDPWNAQTFLSYLRVYDTALAIEEAKRATAAVKPRQPKAKPIINVSFDQLKAGSYVKSVRNTGTLGGEFSIPPSVSTADHAPKVKTVDGVRAVWFDGKDDFLSSENPAPKGMTDNMPFTFEAFLKTEDGGTLLSLSDEGALGNFAAAHDGLRINGLLRRAPNGKPRGPRLQSDKWAHVVLVYEGSRKPSRVYINGQLANAFNWSSYYAIPGNVMRIGAAFSPRNGEKECFAGGIARMRMWRGMKSSEEIAAMAKASLAKVVVR